jgi:cytochrome c556
MIARHGARPLRILRAAAASLAAVALLALPGPGESALRPLVREMLENLAALDAIGKGLALDDFGAVVGAAEELEKRALALKDFDIASAGLAAERDDQFDAYLSVQVEGARAIRDAARDGDARGVVLGYQSLTGGACLGCHLDFRGSGGSVRTPVLLMTVLMGAWTEMNRGLMLGDYDVVARRARQVDSVSQVFTWDQVIQDAFGIADPKQRARFRSHLRALTTEALKVEQAALGEKPERVIEGMGRMWTQGCLACHEAFRSGG